MTRTSVNLNRLMQTDEHSTNNFDSAKYALTNEIFHKGILFNVGDATEQAVSKLKNRIAQEPFWEALGALLCLV
jgi:hypothetical protein